MLFWLLSILTLTDSVIGSFLYQIGYGRDVAIGIIYVKYAIFAFLFAKFLIEFARRPVLYPSEIAGVAYFAMTLLLSIAIASSYADSDAVSRLYIYYFPVVIYFAGSYMGVTGDMSLRRIVTIYATCYIVLNGIFGLQYYSFGGEILWRDFLNYSRFVAEVKGFSDGIINGLPGNFYYDPYNLQIPRFVGSLGDPLAVGYSAFVVLLALAWVRPPWWRVAAIVVLAMLIGTLTRAAILSVIAGGALYWAFGRRAFLLALGVGVAAIGGVLFLGDAIFATLGDSSTGGHVDSIVQVYDFLSVSGMLLGTLASGNVPFFEPGLLNILFSFGIVPFVLFLAFLGGAFRRSAMAGGEQGFLAVVALGGVITLLVMSSSFLAVTSSWFAWFCFGYASGAMKVRADDAARAPAEARTIATLQGSAA